VIFALLSLKIGAPEQEFDISTIPRMKSGKALPAAWIGISPQYKPERHSDLPETLCQMEAGQVRLR